MNDLSRFGCALFALWLTVVLARLMNSHASALSLDHDSTLSLEKLAQFEVPLACIFFGIFTLAYSGLMIEEALERRNKNKRRVHDKQNLTRRDGTQTTPRMLKQEIEPVSLKDGDDETLSKSDRYEAIDGKFAAAGSNTNLSGGMEKEKIKDTTSRMVAFEQEVRSTFARTAQEAGDGIRRTLRGTKQKLSRNSATPEPQFRSLSQSRQDSWQTLNSWDSDSSGTTNGTPHEKLLNTDQAKEDFKHRVSPGSIVVKNVDPSNPPITHLSPVSVQTDVEHTLLPANRLSPVFVHIDIEPTSSPLKTPAALFDRPNNPIQRIMPVGGGSGRGAEEEEASRLVKGPAFFTRVPFEVRIMIYRYILTTSPIQRAADLVEQLTSGLIARDVSDPSMNLAIDARMLRTCRQIYAETLPILYGDNTFCFTNLSALDTFREEGLATTQCESYNSKCCTMMIDRYLSGKIQIQGDPSLQLGSESERQALDDQEALPRLVTEFGPDA